MHEAATECRFNLDWGLAVRPLAADGCGDAGLVAPVAGGLFLAVVDALGHGREAQEEADASMKYLQQNLDRPLTEMMGGLHAHLRGGRGVVASLCLLDAGSGRLSYVSVGDTLVRKLNGDRHRIYCMPGIVGYQIRSLREGCMDLATGDVLLLHSDGIPANFRNWDAGLLQKGAQAIAEQLVAEYGKRHDDNICLVVKCQAKRSHS